MDGNVPGLFDGGRFGCDHLRRPPLQSLREVDGYDSYEFTGDVMERLLGIWTLWDL